MQCVCILLRPSCPYFTVSLLRICPIFSIISVSPMLAGYGKVNGTTAAAQEIAITHNPSGSRRLQSSSNDRRLLEHNAKVRAPSRAVAFYGAGERKGGGSHRSSMDSKNDRPPDPKHPEGKKEALTSLNGVVAPGLLANGYPGRSGSQNDNDGSGSESGYTTPKKRRNGQRSVQPGRSGKQEAEPLDAYECSEGVLTAARLEDSATKSLASDLPRKNSDGKVKKLEERPGKARSANPVVKEDAWTLFRPPPVFPVDNSSAKIVPKISYASKVKENLNKSDREPLPPTARLSQVPMSAVKTITSASFTNGPLLPGEGSNGCSLPGLLLGGGAAPALAFLAHGGENVASAAADALQKSSLFVYPLAAAPSNMQLSLPSGRQVDPPPAAAPTNQKSLVDIFQNQWGLSFINEPSAGPEGGAEAGSRSAGTGKPAEVTFQGGCPPSVSPQRQEQPFPKAYELDKRTSPPALSRVVGLGPPPALPAEVGGCPPTPGLGAAVQKDAPRGLGAILFNSSSARDPGDERRPASPPTTTAAAALACARKQGHTKGLDRLSGWGIFDLKAAVIYHTKGTCVSPGSLDMPTDDPKRVVLYGEAKDRPDQ
uniref:Nuclear fragile X mental retardation-interacting protein 2 n=1 Tax=Denticeps clupeoides TaxID=299321 RepID=A0AAY4BKJ2_9TELE